MIICKSPNPRCKWIYKTNDNLYIESIISKNQIENWEFVLSQTEKLLAKFDLRVISGVHGNGKN